MTRIIAEVESECIKHNFSLLFMFLPKIIKIGENLTKFWQKQFCTGFWDTLYIVYCGQPCSSDRLSDSFGLVALMCDVWIFCVADVMTIFCAVTVFVFRVCVLWTQRQHDSITWHGDKDATMSGPLSKFSY